MTKWLRHANW